MAYNYTADKEQTKQDFNKVIMEATKKATDNKAVKRTGINKRMTAQEILNLC